MNKSISPSRNKKKAGSTEAAFSYLPSFEIEEDLIRQGYSLIAGVDEAGRGCLAGPLALGMTIYHASFIADPDPLITSSVRDSKKISPKKRPIVLEAVKTHALAHETIMVSHQTIDKHNINGATKIAILKLITSISVKPDIIIMDGNFSFDLDIPFIAVKKGDNRSLSIASASIGAKVTRDRVMEKFELHYPGYGLAQHKGYGTKFHREAIANLGYCPIHRRSYEPVKSMIALEKGHEG